MDYFFISLQQIDNLLWNYLGLLMITSTGIYFTIKSKFFQFRALLQIKSHINELLIAANVKNSGIHPVKLYFASLGGMIGLGNIVAVMSTVSIGGPGSLFWLWCTSFFGMLIKYSEIYLGIKYRVPNNDGGYNGGPMYYLEAVFKNKLMPTIVCFLLCIYGAEVSQFLVITEVVVDTFSINRLLVIITLLILVMLGTIGGIKNLSNICSALMPPFLLSYIGLGTWVIIDNYAKLPGVLLNVLQSAFIGHAPIGGFVGSTILLAAHYGVSRAAYSGDIGIGYDSIIQSETQATLPEQQARMGIITSLTDTLICTISIIIVLLTGVWSLENLKPSQYVMVALSAYVPHIEIYMTLLFFIAGFTTITGYLVVGQKCAQFISSRFGKPIYIGYTIFAFTFFSFHDQEKVMLIMSVSGGLLMICNLFAILKLRQEIKFL